MKKTYLRLAALLLALLMVFSICGCAGGGTGGRNEAFEPLEGEVPVNLEGYEFTVADYESSRWNRERSGTPFADAWIQILDEVEYLYNCKIKATHLNNTEMFNIIQPELAAGGKYADLIITTEWQFGYFLGANLMMDLNELDVNWDNEWWNQSIRETTTYGGRNYVGSGSFAFDTAQTWLMYYNEAIWDQHGFEDPYKLVDEGRWTQDLMAQYCLEAAEDRDGSGKLDSSEDVWGIIATDGDFRDAWFQALGGKYFHTNKDGMVELACSSSHTFDIVEKMYNMVKKDQTWSTVEYENELGRIAHFVSGGALLYAYTPGAPGMQDMEDDWGVIPLPKFDASQEDYISGVNHNAAVFGVSNNNQDLDKVSVMLEALGRHALILEDIFWPDYKETYWRHEEDDTRMVSEYVVGHGRHDIALIMANTSEAFRAARVRLGQTVFGSAGPDFASFVESIEDSVNTMLEDYFTYDETT